MMDNELTIMENKDNWEVICTGAFKPDHTTEIAINNLMQILNINKEQSQALVQKGSSALKNQLDEKSALQLHQSLEEAGVVAILKAPETTVNSSIEKKVKAVNLNLDHLSLEPLNTTNINNATSRSPSTQATTRTTTSRATATREIAAKVAAKAANAKETAAKEIAAKFTEAQDAAARETEARKIAASEIIAKQEKMKAVTRPKSTLFSKLKNNIIPLLILIIILASASYLFNNYSSLLNLISKSPATAQIEALNKTLHYPKINKRILLTLLQSQNYDELESILQKRQSKVDSDINQQSILRNSIIAISEHNEVTINMLTHWIDSTESSFSYLTRGAFYIHQGIAARGDRLISRTSSKRAITQDELYLLAYTDLIKAKSIDNTLLQTYSLLIQINISDNDDNARERFLAEAIKVNPAGYHYRNVYMEYLKPKWGGSLEKMDRFAAETANYITLNPRLNTLLGYKAAEKGNIALNYKKFKQCITHYNEALQHGIKPEWLRKRAYCFFDNGNNEKALADITLFFTYSEQVNDYDKEIKRYLTKKLK